jgi:hypothetical protein
MRVGGDAASLGVAWHEIAALYHTEGRTAAEKAIAGVAHRHQSDAETLRAWLAAFTWQPPPGAVLHVEAPVMLKVAGVEIAGRADLIVQQPEGRWVEVVDEKSGNSEFHDPAAMVQVEAYAVAAAREFGYSQAKAAMRYAQLGDDGWIELDVDVAEAEARLEKIVRRALAQVELEPDAREYRVGDGCTFCPAAGTCPALAREVRPFLAVQGYEPQAITLDNFGAFAAAVDRAGKIVDAAKDARKLFVREHGGRIEADGNVWELRSVSMPESVRKAHTQERLQRSKAK